MKKLLMITTVTLSLILMLTGCAEQSPNIPDTQKPSSSIETESTVDSETDSDDVIENSTDTTPEEPESEPHTHSYSEAVTKDATCTEIGEKTFTCECGDTYTEQIEAIGHNYKEVADSAKTATCTDDGKTADTKCSNCNDLKNGETIPATGHQYGDYTYNKDASYTKDGTKSAVCTVCGDKKTVTAEGTKLSYTYTDASGTKYAKSNVNVRDLPSTDGAKIGSLNKGDAVTVTGVCKETGWYRISYNGGVAYVSNSYLVDTKPEEPKPEPEKPNDSGHHIVSREQCPYPLYQAIETETTLTYYWINADPLVDVKAFMDQVEWEFMKKHNVTTLYGIDYITTNYSIDEGRHIVYGIVYSIYPPQ